MEPVPWFQFEFITSVTLYVRNTVPLYRLRLFCPVKSLIQNMFCQDNFIIHRLVLKMFVKYQYYGTFNAIVLHEKYSKGKIF